jgi:hypothetical protein
MNDRELLQLLPDYVAGRVDSQLGRLIEERCAASEELRSALEAARRYTDALGAIEEVRAPDDFLDKVHRRIEEPSGMLRRLFTPIRRRLPVELAGVLVTALLVLFLFNPFSGELPQLRTSRPVQKYESRQQPAPVSPAAIPQEQFRSDTDTKSEKKQLAQSEQSLHSRQKKLPAARAERVPTSPPVTMKPAPKATSFASASDAKAPESENNDAEKLLSGSLQMETGRSPGAENTLQDDNVGARRSSAPAQAVRNTDTYGSAAVIATPSASAAPSPAPPAAVAENRMTLEKKTAPELNESAAQPQSTMKRKMSAPRRSVARAFKEERSPEAEAAPFADEDYSASEPEPTELLATTRKAVQRYQGSIDTVFTVTPQMVSLRITLPSGKLDGIYRRLSRSYSVTITDTLPPVDQSTISLKVVVRLR